MISVYSPEGDVQLTQRPTTSRLLSDEEAAAARLMMRVRFYAETVDLVSASAEPGIDLDDFTTAIDALAIAGVARGLAPLTADAYELSHVAAAALAAIEHSPNPDIEWSLVHLLGDGLAALVGTSVSSMHRYRSGERRTPDDVAARLHVITLIVADLAGSYNEYGIRRWFDRPRSALDGRAPKDVFHGAWDPASDDVGKVRRLASTLAA